MDSMLAVTMEGKFILVNDVSFKEAALFLSYVTLFFSNERELMVWEDIVGGGGGGQGQHLRQLGCKKRESTHFERPREHVIKKELACRQKVYGKFPRR